MAHSSLALYPGSPPQGVCLDSPLSHIPFPVPWHQPSKVRYSPSLNKTSKALSYRRFDSLCVSSPADFSLPVFVRSTSNLLASVALLTSGHDQLKRRSNLQDLLSSCNVMVCWLPSLPTTMVLPILLKFSIGIQSHGHSHYGKAPLQMQNQSGSQTQVRPAAVNNVLQLFRKDLSHGSARPGEE